MLHFIGFINVFLNLNMHKYIHTSHRRWPWILFPKSQFLFSLSISAVGGPWFDFHFQCVIIQQCLFLSFSSLFSVPQNVCLFSLWLCSYIIYHRILFKKNSQASDRLALFPWWSDRFNVCGPCDVSPHFQVVGGGKKMARRLNVCFKCVIDVQCQTALCSIFSHIIFSIK